MSEFIDTFVKFSNFMSLGEGGGLLTPCFVLRGRFLYRMIVPGEGSHVLGVCPGGMVLDEISSYIT